jgi:hypothetical protein
VLSTEKRSRIFGWSVTRVSHKRPAYCRSLWLFALKTEATRATEAFIIIYQITCRSMTADNSHCHCSEHPYHTNFTLFAFIIIKFPQLFDIFMNIITAERSVNLCLETIQAVRAQLHEKSRSLSSLTNQGLNELVKTVSLNWTACRYYKALGKVYGTWDYWDFGPCPSSVILKNTKKHSVSENVSVTVLWWLVEYPCSVGSVRKSWFQSLLLLCNGRNCAPHITLVILRSV